MEKVLITGICGGLGRLLARRLRPRFAVCGVDRVGWPGAPGGPQGITVYSVDLRKQRMAEIFRRERPNAVVHMGFIRSFRGSDRERYDVNVRGTKQLLDHCLAYDVGKLVVLSSSDVYGAFPENPYYMDESHPLAASRDYPEMRDLVELDTLASVHLWRYPHIRTCVLRPVHVLGYYVQSAIGRYLKERRVPTVLGFDPMMQFIHEEDLSLALAGAVEHGLRGVFNVPGPGAVPLHTAIRECGGTAVPLPEPILRPLLGRLFRWGIFPYPAGAFDYLKYPLTVTGERFVEALNFRPRFGLKEIFHSVEH